MNTRLLLTGFLLLISVSANTRDIPVPEGGILDLGDYSIMENAPLKLNGEWEFYWESFVEPHELISEHAPAPTLFCQVPGYWIDYHHETLNFIGTGYSTYRLRIILPGGFDGNVGIDMPVFDVAVRVYLDGYEVYTSGQPGYSEATSSGGYKPATLIYSPISDTLEILLHVSNFQHRRGGFWNTMQIGSPDRIIQMKQVYRLVSSISLGMLLAFSLFFLFFHIFYRKDKIVLTFALILAGVFIRMLNTDLYQINYIVNIAWDWIIRLEYLGTFLAFGAALWYFHRLFPAGYMLWFARVNTLLVILSSIVILFFKVRVFAWTMMYFQPAVVLVMVYYLVACTRKALRGDREKIIFLFGMLVFMAGLINDILVSNSVSAIHRAYIVHFALQIFIFIQAVLIIRGWIRAYVEREKLMNEIAYINKNLENLVDERTLEINRRNREIQHKNDDIEARNKELSEALEFKNKIFSIIAHDLKSPIASLVQNSVLLDFDLSKKDTVKLLTSFRELSSSALNLIDNLLYWGRSQGAQLSYKPEKIYIKDLMDEVYKLFGEMARQKDIRLQLNMEEGSSVIADRELLEITCRNLVSNSLKFTGKGGTVDVSTDKSTRGKLEISVRDNGVGIPPERLKDILQDTDMVSTNGTEKEKGTGLGLKLCQELMLINRGELKIESREGEGTKVRLILPGSDE